MPLLAKSIRANQLEQLEQLASLCRAQRSHYFLGELALKHLPISDMSAPGRCELNQYRPTIARRWATGKEPLSFEGVNGGRDGARREPQMGCQVAHARRHELEHGAQQAGARDRAVEAGQACVMATPNGLGKRQQRFNQLCSRGYATRR